jgi:RimJ/RimL family protein N-acetyltransferase
MLELEKINPGHFKKVFDLHRDYMPTFEMASLDHFVVYFYRVEGWVINKDGEVIACVYLDNFNPGVDIIIHCVANARHKSAWINRTILKEIGTFVYQTLGLPRMTGYSIEGKTNRTGRFLEHIGFKLEGTIRKGTKVDGQLYDLNLYGMLREECLWI